MSELVFTKRDRYYVYTLARPDGTVFYVGKGKGRRAFSHEKNVLNGAYDGQRDSRRS